MKKHLVAGAAALAVVGSGASAVSAQNPTVPKLGFDITSQAVTVEGAPRIGTGHYRITLENKGRQAGVALVQLKPGVTVEQFGAAVPNVQDPSQIQQYGTVVASNFWERKGSYTTTIRLSDADYVFVDVTKRPAPRMSFHAGPQAGGAAKAPKADASVRLKDYRFEMPSTLKAGKATIRTTNAGKNLHHALVMPLKKGVSGARVLKDLKVGKEPRYAIGGPPSALVEVVSPKTTNNVEVNLRKGRYLFVCFLQNSPKSKPHAMQGMRKIVTVK